jgi:hypothetical protein
MVYAKPVPAWMRRILVRAAESGLAKNFTHVIRDLSRFVVLGEPHSVSPESTGTDVPVHPAAEKLSTRRGPTTLLTGRRSAAALFVDDALLAVFLPPAQTVVGFVTRRVPSAEEAGVHALAAVLAAAVVGCVLQAVLTLWHAAGAVCTTHGSAAACAWLRVYNALDLPRPMVGLYVVIGVLFLVKHLLSALAIVRPHLTSRACCIFEHVIWQVLAWASLL